MPVVNNWTIAPLSEHAALIPRLATLHQAQWQDLHPRMSVSAWEAEFSWHMTTAIPATLVAVDEHGGLLGSASLVHDDMDGMVQLSPWLANVLVLPEARGKGVGAALIDAIATAARAQGHARLYLFTTDRADFYLQRNWVHLENRIHHGKTVSLMYRSLA